jgi:DNA-binding NarL/FixJ family response regulator
MEQPSGDRVRLLIVDDHELFRAGLVRLLASQPDFQVVGEATDAEDGIRQAALLQPDVVLLDVVMPGRAGLEVLGEIAAISPCRVLLLTAEIDRRDIAEALRLGARGVVLKHSGAILLYKAIRAIMTGQYWVTHESVSDLVQLLRQAGARNGGPAKFGLTPRELQIVSAIVAGCSNREISQQFAVSADTVKHHVSNIFDKLGVSNRVELTLFAIDHKLVDREQQLA